MNKVRVKICCINSVEEAALVIKYGACAIGLVSAMPSGPGPIEENLIAEIAAKIPPGVSSFLLTCKQNVDEIIEQQKRTGVNTIQLVDNLEKGTLADLKKALPGIAIVQVIHVNEDNSVKEALDATPFVNALLLDSGNQKLPVKILGGTGKIHNWEISRKIVEAVDVPVFLAGGLNPGNVAEAIKKVKPYGVDVCSGLRVNGNLAEEKVKSFFEAVGSIL